MLQKNLLFLLCFLPTLINAQTLTNTTSIEITKTWSQEPSGWTYPVNINLPASQMPSGGYPVAILLHGNGGNGNNIHMQWANILTDHILVAPSGYLTSWNIADERSNAPDVEMIEELVDQLQTYNNVNPSKIRLIGSSNGSGLCNRVFIENDDPGIDIICTIVSQLNVPQYHNNNFHFPSGETGDPAPFDGYDTPKTPITGRRFLTISNDNDPIIPYKGGPSVVGVDFLDSQEAAYIIAKSQGYTGGQLPEEGTQIGTTGVFEYVYLDHQVVHLRGNARHSANVTQREYVGTYFNMVFNDNDIDNDGFTTDIDCNDNDASIGAKQTAGTTCDDGDATTENDQIQADGCSCVGTKIACIENGGDADGDGICADVDCNDNDASIGAKQTAGTTCDDGDATTENDQIQADGCSCMGTPLNNAGCQAPTNPTVNGSSERKVIIDWESVDGALHYAIQIRFKGIDRWLVTSNVKSTQVQVYGPIRNYEYRLKTICEDGESVYGPINEFSIPTMNGLTSATSRNKEKEAVNIIIEEEAILYPNPVNTQLNLMYQPKTKKARFLIYDSSGKEVYMQELSESTNTYSISLDNLKAGFYLGIIKEKGSIHFFEKIIKL